jgi:hypothetical protein
MATFLINHIAVLKKVELQLCTAEAAELNGPKNYFKMYLLVIIQYTVFRGTHISDFFKRKLKSVALL